MKSFLKKKKSKGVPYASDNYHGQSLKISDVFGGGIVEDDTDNNPYQPYVPPPVKDDDVVYSWSDKIPADAAPERLDDQKPELLNDTMESADDEEPVPEKERVISDTRVQKKEGQPLAVNKAVAKNQKTSPSESTPPPAVFEPIVEDLFANNPAVSLYSAPSEDLIPDLEEKFQSGFFADNNNTATITNMEALEPPSQKPKEKPVRISVLEVSEDKQKAMDEIDNLVDEFNETAIGDLDDASSSDDSSSDDHTSDNEEEFEDLEDLDDEQLEKLVGDLEVMSSSDSDFSTDEDEDDDETHPEVKAEHKSDRVVVKASLPAKESSNPIASAEEEKKEDKAQDEFQAEWKKHVSELKPIPGSESPKEEVSPPSSRDTSSKTGSSGGSNADMKGRLVSNEADQKDEGRFGGISLQQMFWDDYDESVVGEDDVESDNEDNSEHEKTATEASKPKVGKEDPDQSRFGVEAQDKGTGAILLLDKFAGTPVESHEPGKLDPNATAVRKGNRPFAKRVQSVDKKKAPAPKQAKVKLAKSTSKMSALKNKITRSTSKKKSQPAESAKTAPPPSAAPAENPEAQATASPRAVPSEPQTPETPVHSSEAPKAKDTKTIVEQPQEAVVKEHDSEFKIFTSMIQDVYAFTFGHFGASSSTQEKASTTTTTSKSTASPSATTTPTKPEVVTTPTSSEGSQSPTTTVTSEQTAVLDDQGYEVHRGQAADEIHEVASGKGFEFSQKIHTILRNKGKAQHKTNSSSQQQEKKKKSKLKSLFSRKKGSKTTKQ